MVHLLSMLLMTAFVTMAGQAARLAPAASGATALTVDGAVDHLLRVHLRRLTATPTPTRTRTTQRHRRHQDARRERRALRVPFATLIRAAQAFVRAAMSYAIRAPTATPMCGTVIM